MTQVYFSMPLVGARSVEQWREVETRLSDTLQSIQQMTDPDFRVVITGHERPNIQELEDPRVHFIQAAFDKPAGPHEFTRDKSRKQRSSMSWIKGQGGGFVVMADADDLFHRDLVGYVREQDNPNGYVIRTGYVFSMATGHLAPIPGAWSRTFDAICGSSAILRLAPEDIDAGSESYLAKLGPHNRIAENAAELGRSLAEISWPACVYVLGEKETVSIMVNRTPERQEQLRDIIIRRSVPVTAEIEQDFSLARLVAKCATK